MPISWRIVFSLFLFFASYHPILAESEFFDGFTGKSLGTSTLKLDLDTPEAIKMGFANLFNYNISEIILCPRKIKNPSKQQTNNKKIRKKTSILFTQLEDTEPLQKEVDFSVYYYAHRRIHRIPVFLPILDMDRLNVIAFPNDKISRIIDRINQALCYDLAIKDFTPIKLLYMGDRDLDPSKTLSEYGVRSSSFKSFIGDPEIDDETPVGTYFCVNTALHLDKSIKMCLDRQAEQETILYDIQEELCRLIDLINDEKDRFDNVRYAYDLFNIFNTCIEKSRTIQSKYLTLLDLKKFQLLPRRILRLHNFLVTDPLTKKVIINNVNLLIEFLTDNSDRYERQENKFACQLLSTINKVSFNDTAEKVRSRYLAKFEDYVKTYCSQQIGSYKDDEKECHTVRINMGGANGKKLLKQPKITQLNSSDKSKESTNSNSPSTSAIKYSSSKSN